MDDLRLLQQIEDIIEETIFEVPEEDFARIEDDVCRFVKDRQNQVIKLALINIGSRDMYHLVQGLENLHTLYLSGNNLTHFPAQLKGLKNLHCLSLSANCLSTLPEGLGGLSNLQRFDLSSNRFSTFPEELVELEQLQELCLGFNGFSSIHIPRLKTLQNLTGLDISGNELGVFPPELAELKELRSLTISSNRIARLPGLISELKNLQELDAGYNELTMLPQQIRELKNLHTFKLNSNRFSMFPNEITKCPNLHTLDLCANEISMLPREIGQLKHLLHLGLNDNQLRRLPDQLWELKSLQYLGLSNNRLSMLPGAIKNMAHLVRLDLSNNGLDVLPEQISELSRLQNLDLGSNRFRTLPEEIRGLKKLVSLGLCSNGLTQVPPAVFEFKKLLHLDLSNNRISILPAKIEKLKNLKTLFLNSNEFSAFPGEVTALHELKTLDLRDNQIRTLPDIIRELHTLESLDVSDNRISSLSAKIGELHHLQSLKLSSNKINRLPREITGLQLGFHLECEKLLPVFCRRIITNRKGVCLSQNPVEKELGSIIKQGRRALLTYFMSQQESQKSINEMKVILIGEGGSGKTSLVKQIFGEPFDKNEAQTHGIIIKNRHIQLEGRAIKVHFWDFGGQQIMHAAHQFFLSEKTLYILVLDARETDSKIADLLTRKYLKQIKTFGGDSPILVVINKIDENPGFDLNRKSLNTHYPILDYFKVSCQTGENIPGFLQKLERHIGEFKNLSALWAESWFNVKNELERRSDNYITYDQFTSLCKQYSIEDKTSIEILLVQLDFLGIITNFTNLELQDTKILKPRWVTNAIYRIINSRTVENRRGIVGKGQINQILHSDDECRDLKARDKLLCTISYTPTEQTYIIALMKEFEICYERSDGTLLIPSLLGKNEPDFDFDEENALKVRIDYSYLPDSVLPQLIIRMQSSIYRNTMWRSGMLIGDKEDGWQALVRGNIEDDIIHIYIAGPLKREGLAAILGALKDINNRFEQIEIECLIEIEKSNLFYPYVQLLNLLKMGESEVVIPELGKRYSIRGILGEYERTLFTNSDDKKFKYQGDLYMPSDRCRTHDEFPLYEEQAAPAKAPAKRIDSSAGTPAADSTASHQLTGSEVLKLTSRLNKLKRQIKTEKKLKAECDRIAGRRASLVYLATGSIMVITAAVSGVLLFWKEDFWNILEPWTYNTGLILPGILLILSGLSNIPLSLESVRQKRYKVQQKRIYALKKFNPDELEELQKQYRSLDEKLSGM